MTGSSNDIDRCEIEPKDRALCRKAPYKANPTKAAEPMANPLPIAAVVFPAASSRSVL